MVRSVLRFSFSATAPKGLDVSNVVCLVKHFICMTLSLNDAQTNNYLSNKIYTIRSHFHTHTNDLRSAHTHERVAELVVVVRSYVAGLFVSGVVLCGFGFGFRASFNELEYKYMFT